MANQYLRTPTHLPWVLVHFFFFLSFLIRRFFKFQRQPPKKQSQKQLHSFPGNTDDLLKHTHSGADNGMIDTAPRRNACLPRNGDFKWVRLLLSNKFTCKWSCESCGFLILHQGWKRNELCSPPLSWSPQTLNVEFKYWEGLVRQTDDRFVYSF